MVLRVNGLQTTSSSAGSDLPGSDLPETVVQKLVEVEDAPLRYSPATAAIQDGDAVRRILEHRSSRGKTQLETVRVQKSSKRVRLETGKRKGSTSVGTKNFRLAQSGIDIPYELTIQVLRIYSKSDSGLALARKTIVPSEDIYPSELHGVDIAGTVYDMKWWQKHVKQQPDRVAELNKLGFIWERLQPEWNLVLEGLVTYGIINGHLLVPAKFIIPHNDSRWPKALWGMALGNSVGRIRSRGDFLRGNKAWARTNQLENIGFVWDSHEVKFLIFCNALRAYSTIEGQKSGPKRVGALNIPTQFVIPSSEPWPKELWGYQLGAKCTAVRQKQVYVKGHPDRLQKLADLGFQLGGNESLSWLKCIHAAAIFSQMNQRKLDVPQAFVVPAPPKLVKLDAESSSSEAILGSDDAWPWPGKIILLCSKFALMNRKAYTNFHF